MTRRLLLGAILPALCATRLRADSASKNFVRGRLEQPATLLLPDGRHIKLEGDEPTQGVLNDKRLAGCDFEAHGHFTAASQFAVDPIHLRAMFVYKEGRQRMVTYWCDVCYIRTYTPGVCWCCQKDTDLDLIDPGA